VDSLGKFNCSDGTTLCRSAAIVSPMATVSLNMVLLAANAILCASSSALVLEFELTSSSSSVSYSSPELPLEEFPLLDLDLED
jgi:hypothetical protein